MFTRNRQPSKLLQPLCVCGISAVVLAVLFIWCRHSYFTIKGEEMRQLHEATLDRVGLIESVGRYDAMHWESGDGPSSSIVATLQQVTNAFGWREDAGRPFSLATFDAAGVVFIQNIAGSNAYGRDPQSFALLDAEGNPFSIPLDRIDGSPMAQALRGEVGVREVTLPDGDTVFAAFSPVNISGKRYGLVLHASADHVTREVIYMAWIGGGIILSIWILNGVALLRNAYLNRDLEISQSLYREAQSLGKVGHWRYEYASDSLIWSDEVFSVFGQDPKSFVPTFDCFLQCVHPDDREMVSAAFTDAIASHTQYSIDHRIVLQEGMVKYVHEECVTQYDEEGNPVVSFGVMQDITDRKETENAMRTAKEAAEDAGRVKDEFLANISHEIRTPLNGVYGMLQLLAESDLNQDQSELAGIAVSSCKHLITLLTDILDISSIKSGNLMLSRAPFDPMELVGSIEEIFRDTAKGKGIELTSTVDRSVSPLLVADDVRLRQILFNLVGNAIKFTHEGRVEISCAQNSADYGIDLHIAVTDTGIGIPKDMQENIFDAFRQVDGSHTREFGGVGLGLTIVDRLVKGMGGSLHLESAEGEGSVFSFIIPVGVCNAADLFEKMHSADSNNDSGLNVLVVEDDQVNQVAIMRFLEKLGHEPFAVSNGQLALDAIKDGNYDVVLMDIQMPVMNGYEAVDALRNTAEYERWRELPIIALTANAMSGDRQKCLDAGMDDYLSKPVDIRTLDSALVRSSAAKGQGVVG